MQHEGANTQRPRVLVVDDHDVSRAAIGALLRTEGLDVVADVRVGEQAVAAAEAFDPNVAIVDVSPDTERGLGIACRLRMLPCALTVVLTSSANRASFDARLEGFGFIAKADICADAVLRHITRRC